MEEIVTIEEFCRLYNVHEAVRKMKGWEQNGVKRTTQEKFENMKETQEESKVGIGEKRPASGIKDTSFLLLYRKHYKPMSNERVVGTASSVIVSEGSILESEEVYLPLSRGSILQSESHQASLWDEEAHMTTQSSPPPIILSSVIDK